MTNELIFAAHVALVSTGVVAFARMGKTALTTCITLLFLMANIFVIKQIELFGFCVTSTDAFIVGISFGCNLLQEFWGKQAARAAIWISFAASMGYMIIAYLIVAYQPASCDLSNVHFVHITQHCARIVLASFAAYLITQMLDIALYGWLKQNSSGKHFVLRNYGAIAVSQLTDTILFSFLGLYGIVENIFDVMILSFVIKIIAILMTTPFLVAAKRLKLSN
jgi:uncharacterized integral membrane protein (TIGR00697 family)